MPLTPKTSKQFCTYRSRRADIVKTFANIAHYEATMDSISWPFSVFLDRGIRARAFWRGIGACIQLDDLFRVIVLLLPLLLLLLVLLPLTFPLPELPDVMGLATSLEFTDRRCCHGFLPSLSFNPFRKLSWISSTAPPTCTSS